MRPGSTHLTEKIEELRSQTGRILARARCEGDEDLKIFAEKLEQAKRNYNDLIECKTALTAERQDGIVMYEDTYERIQPCDEKEVEEERERLRAERENRIPETVSKNYDKDFDPNTLSDATKETDLDLFTDRRVADHRKVLHEHGREHQRVRHRSDYEH